MGLLRSIKKRRDDFLFNWNRRRYSYRMGWYYARLSMVSSVVIIISFVLFFLLRLDSCRGRKCGVFRTYVCSPTSYGLISSAFISLGSIYSVKSALSYMLSRLLYSFANYRTTDFMALGKIASLLGAMVKHVPFAISICTICNGIICLTGVIYMVIGLCDKSYLPQAQIIVDNCRLYVKSCENPSVKSVLDCNDPSHIISSPFLQLRCLPGSSEICRYSQELQSGSNPCTREKLRNYLISTGDEEVIGELRERESRETLSVCDGLKDKSGCEASEVVDYSGNGDSARLRSLDDTDPSSTYITTLQGKTNKELLDLYLIPVSLLNQEELVSGNGYSDLYAALRVWIAVTCYIFVSTTILFFFIKYFSPQDSCFSFVRRPNELFILKVLNVFTPWQ